MTAGAMDDAFRNAITMMAHIHFVTTKEAANRVRQFGEFERIHLTGSPGVDLAMSAPVITAKHSSRRLGLSHSNIMSWWHFIR